MAKKVAETINIDLTLAWELLKWLAWDTVNDMSCNKVNIAEERRVWWTTYSNLELWFHDLMAKDIQGRSHISHKKLQQMLNVNMTSLLLDDSSINQGGQSAAFWFDS
jgi:hypothetical protein